MQSTVQGNVLYLYLERERETFWSMDMARRILGFTPKRARNSWYAKYL